VRINVQLRIAAAGAQHSLEKPLSRTLSQAVSMDRLRRMGSRYSSVLGGSAVLPVGVVRYIEGVLPSAGALPLLDGVETGRPFSSILIA